MYLLVNLSNGETLGCWIVRIGVTGSCWRRAIDYAGFMNPLIVDEDRGRVEGAIWTVIAEDDR